MDLRSKSALAMDQKQKFEPYRSAVKVKNLTSINHWDLTELRRKSHQRENSGDPMPPKLTEYFANKSPRKSFNGSTDRNSMVGRMKSTDRSSKPYVMMNNPKRKITPLRNPSR